jgi:protein-S-isoprenylcysteine O-methyltransferase Ste14
MNTKSFIHTIPYGLRSLFYGLFFLFVLHVIVWLNLHWDVYFPWMHIEIGAMRGVGWSIVMVGMTLYTVTAIQLCARGKGPFAEFDPPTALVTTGPYRYVRNPISSCVLAIILGEALAFSSTGVLMMLFVSMAIAQAQAVGIEEPLLLKRFGQEYSLYQSRVPRWIPRWYRQ